MTVSAPAEITADFVRSCLPRRPADAHKGDFGVLGVVAGSYGMAGAPSFVANAAYRAGVGLVYGFLPRSVYPIVASLCPEAVFYPGGDKPRALARHAGRLTALVVGPGRAETRATAALVEWAISSRLPLCLDAGGINALRGDLEKLRGSPAVITPHAGEAARALGVTPGEINRDRPAAARELANRSGSVAVLKGKDTLVASGDGLLVCRLGNSGMATAGSGDVLSGVIGALLAGGVAPREAAAAGVYIHALAGDIAAGKTGGRSLIARDIIESLPDALKLLER